MITIKDARKLAERINNTHGTTLQVERRYNYYNVYINIGEVIGLGLRTAREAQNVLEAFASGLHWQKKLDK